VIRVLDGVPDNVLAVEAVGKVTEADYESVLAPAVRAKLDAHGKLRFVYVLGEEFDGWTMGAMWQDAQLGASDVKAWEKVAIVTDKDWPRHVVQAFGWMIPGDIRIFGLSDLDAATAWATA
jgi:hypothetical protein